MKKISIVLAFSLLFAGLSNATIPMKQQKATDKKEEKKADKKEVKKVPSKKKQDKKNK